MTLHDSLMARLDRLGPAKEVAQIGAVIGANFRTNYCTPSIRSSEDHCRLAKAVDRRRTALRPRDPARGDVLVQACADPRCCI